MTSIAQCLKAGEEALAEAGIPDAFRQATSLLQFAIARDRAFIIANPDYDLSDVEFKLFGNCIARRAAREPYQHIVGRQEFYGLDFLVTPDVLIPRPETELIVERAIELLSDARSPRFLEIGVGSGCISVAILKQVAMASGLAVDISEPALGIARRNAEMHDVAARLGILYSNVYESVTERNFDLIVSNPPYVPIAQYAGLQPEVRDHDPRAALTDEATGLTIIQRIIEGAPNFLRRPGGLLVEIGFGQHEQVAAFFDRASWGSVHFIDDLQGIPRTVDAALA